jgi:ABC-type sugar transport system permease subunit
LEQLLRRHSTGNGQQAAGVAFTAPVPIFLLLFILFPLISNIQLSLTEQGGKFVGFAHYVEVLTDASIWASALVTTIYVCVSVVF